MPKYIYKVRDSLGRLQSGTIDGNSVEECMGRLEAKSLIPILIDELNFDGTKKDRSTFEKLDEWMAGLRSKVPYRSVVFFTRQLATLINGGVALPRAVEQLSRNEQPVFKRILDTIGDDLGMGSTFSDCLAKHPQVFNHMFVSVIRAGEVSGALDRVLLQLADYMENHEAMKAKVKAAMRYPQVISLLVGTVVIGILIWLVPVFREMYSGFGAKLPTPTLILIAISDAIRNNAIVVFLVALAITGLIAFLFLAVDMTKYLFDKYVLRMPIFGDIVRKNILSVYCRTMSLLMESGTPILEATQIAGGAVNNKFYAEALESVYSDLKQGELLSASLTKANEFPPLVTQLVATGEESGRIDELLQKAADFYDREIRNVVESLATIIEPILIVVLGAIVGGILIALYLPVFSLGKIIK